MHKQSVESAGRLEIVDELNKFVELHRIKRFHSVCQGGISWPQPASEEFAQIAWRPVGNTNMRTRSNGRHDVIDG